MLFSASLLTLVLPLVSALTVSVPPVATSGGTITISWTRAADDPESVAIELVNSVLFNEKFAIGNNVDVFGTDSITITLPSVPADNRYTIQLVGNFDINNVLAESGPISISTESTTLTTLRSTSRSSSSSTRSSSASANSTSSSTSLATTSSSSTGAFGVTRTPTTSASETAAASSTPTNAAVPNAFAPSFLFAAIAGVVGLAI